MQQPGHLSITGDLTFSVDGPGGATAGTVSGAGSTVRVHAEDPVAAWDGALGSVSTGPAVLAEVARHLHDQGIVLEVSGPDGLVATVGAGVSSSVGRLLAGSRFVRLGRPAAVRPLAIAELRRRRVPIALAAVGATVLAVLLRRARR